MNTKTLEQRVATLEEFVEKIIALPHLSNLAGRDSSNFITRLKKSIAADKERLATDLFTDQERQALEAKINRDEYLVSPALDAKLRDSALTESQSGQAIHAE